MSHNRCSARICKCFIWVALVSWVYAIWFLTPFVLGQEKVGDDDADKRGRSQEPSDQEPSSRAATLHQDEDVQEDIEDEGVQV